MKSTTISVDLAKSVFQIAVSHHPGKVAESHRVSRAQFARFFAQRQPALVLLEACGSAHYWARQLQGMGHEVLLLPPHATRPYVQRDKTDRADAKALLEAHRNEQIHPVPVKTVAQQSLAGLHRLRASWMRRRTAQINTLRGVLREMGEVLPVGSRVGLARARLLLAQEPSELPGPLREALREVGEEIAELERRIHGVEQHLQALAKQMPAVECLRSIPGVGLLTATALVAWVGEVQRFPSSRQFASYLGLTPREHSSGLKRRLGSISKRGDGYLRTLLIHGARSVLWAAKRQKQPDRLRSWALELEKRRGANKATVALANKLARIIWAVWRQDRRFTSQPSGARPPIPAPG
jgi:transposase